MQKLRTPIQLFVSVENWENSSNFKKYCTQKQVWMKHCTEEEHDDGIEYDGNIHNLQT